MNKNLKRYAVIIVTTLVFLSTSACTTHHILGKDSNISIRDRSDVISAYGEHYIVRDLELTNEKLSGRLSNSGDELHLERDQVSQIRTTSHTKGLVRGAGYGALSGVGLGIMASVSEPVLMLPLAVGFATIFAIPAGTVGLLAGYQDIYHITNKDVKVVELPRNNALHERSKYYGGISYKVLTGNTPNRIGGTSWNNLAPLNTTTPVFEFGLTFNPHLLVGVEFNAYEFNDYYYGRTSTNYNWEDFVDFLVTTTIFPDKHGKFWKIGAGVTNYTDHTEYYPVNPSKEIPIFTNVTHNEQGLATHISLGYAYWLGEHINLTVSADLNSHYFQWQRNSHFIGLSVGGYWY